MCVVRLIGFTSNYKIRTAKLNEALCETHFVCASCVNDVIILLSFYFNAKTVNCTELFVVIFCCFQLLIFCFNFFFSNLLNMKQSIFFVTPDQFPVRARTKKTSINNKHELIFSWCIKSKSIATKVI